MVIFETKKTPKGLVICKMLTRIQVYGSSWFLCLLCRYSKAIQRPLLSNLSLSASFRPIISLAILTVF